MKKTTKVGIGVLVGALALTIMDDLCLRTHIRDLREREKVLEEDLEKETNDSIDWQFMARDYRWHRDFIGLEELDKRHDQLFDNLLKR